MNPKATLLFVVRINDHLSSEFAPSVQKSLLKILSQASVLGRSIDADDKAKNNDKRALIEQRKDEKECIANKPQSFTNNFNGNFFCSFESYVK